MSEKSTDNVYLKGSLASVFIKTATPIIFMMLVNGSFNVVDAYFLGTYVGDTALAAVTSMFPLFMLLVALSTLVANGFASVMARLLGAGKFPKAESAFAQAITLSLAVCLLLISLFLVGGKQLTLLANNDVSAIADMSYGYISILIFCSPLMFILSINGDCLRCEGQVSFMALISLISVLLNTLFNYFLIVHLDYGVIGSAIGTVLAQSFSILILYLFRRYKPTKLNIQVISLSWQRDCWKSFLALGAPTSLNYLGVVLSSAAILYNLQVWNAENYSVTVSAYGIITRVMMFIYLPLLGLSMAFQSITGNNVGANNIQRTNSGIKIALFIASMYCMVMQVVVFLVKDRIGAWFVDEVAVIHEVSRILPFSTLALFLVGPLLMISAFFQSIGDAVRAGLLGLTKAYVFFLPMVFIFPQQYGEWGIWYAGPSAEAFALLFTCAVLYQHARGGKYRFGLFRRV